MVETMEMSMDQPKRNHKQIDDTRLSKISDKCNKFQNPDNICSYMLIAIEIKINI